MYPNIMFPGISNKYLTNQIEDDGMLGKRRGSLQLWATYSVENLSLSHDDSAVQTCTRGRSKLRKNKCLSWLGMYTGLIYFLLQVYLKTGMIC